MLWIVVALGIILDQLTKFWVVGNLPFQQAIPIIPKILDFNYIHNEGAAWSILNGRVGLLTIVTIAITIGVIVVWYRTPKTKKYLRLAYALLVAGALGNIIDRVRLGYVVDFIQVPFWPVFNIADCLLVISVVAICIMVMFETKQEMKEAKEDLDGELEQKFEENIEEEINEELKEEFKGKYQAKPEEKAQKNAPQANKVESAGKKQQTKPSGKKNGKKNTKKSNKK